MRKKLTGTPALVIAVIALFVALGGGYAIGSGFIGTGDLNGHSKEADLGTRSLHADSYRNLRLVLPASLARKLRVGTSR